MIRHGHYKFMNYVSNSHFTVDIGYTLGDLDESNPCIVFADTKARAIEQMEGFIKEATQTLERIKAMPEDPWEWSYTWQREHEGGS